MNTRDSRQLYLDVWKNVLISFLDWSERDVGTFAEKWADHMKEDGIFYHWSPLHYISGLLIPESLEARLNPVECEKILLERDIEGAISGGMGMAYVNDGFDWRAARDRVAAVLRAYGYSLADCKGGNQT